MTERNQNAAAQWRSLADELRSINGRLIDLLSTFATLDYERVPGDDHAVDEQYRRADRACERIAEQFVGRIELLETTSARPEPSAPPPD